MIPPPGTLPGAPVQNTPLVQSCPNPNMDVRVVTAATPPPTAYEGEVTQPITVVVDVAVDVDGTVAGLRIYKSSGNAKLDKAAMAAAHSSKFSPQVIDCNPTRATYLFRVNFAPPSPSPNQ
jgi:TonB family protein